jgi:hypothetical protein
MLNKRRGVFSTIAVTAAALLALCGIAAGSAQAASWHVEGKEFTGETNFGITAGGTFDMDAVAGWGLRCETSQNPFPDIGYINGTRIIYFLRLNHCEIINRSPWEKAPCYQVENTTEPWNQPGLELEGTGASASQIGAKFYINWKSGTGCPMPLKTEIKGVSLTNNFNGAIEPEYSNEGVELYSHLSGTGNYGATSMTVTGTQGWHLASPGLYGKPWGWY